jgi:micrococcal nuclease
VKAASTVRRGAVGKGPRERNLAGRLPYYAPNDKELSRLETEARTAHKGLWSDPDPVAPWDWRKGVGVPETTGVVGNRKSHVFHKSSCRSVVAMKNANKVLFDSAEAAEKAGYRKAKDCW